MRECVLQVIKGMEMKTLEKQRKDREDGHERMHAAGNWENALLLKWLGTGMKSG